MSNCKYVNSICAGIVTYNPNIELLRLNINAIHNQVFRVIIVDNASCNRDEILELKKDYPDIILVQNEKNVGIAKALNQIGDKATELDCSWFLTLDQDSISPKNMISEYEKYTSKENIAIICPHIVLRVLGQDSLIDYFENCEYVDTTITSGSLIRTMAWGEVKGFWEYLFIDKVDDDFCYAIRNNGWKILRCNTVLLEHEIGNPKLHKFFWKKFYTDSYPSFRYYYIARNTIIFYYCYKKNNICIWKILFKRGIKILIGEANKFNKIIALYNGIHDGIGWEKKYGKRREPKT